MTLTVGGLSCAAGLSCSSGLSCAAGLSCVAGCYDPTYSRTSSRQTTYKGPIKLVLDTRCSFYQHLLTTCILVLY